MLSNKQDLNGKILNITHRLTSRTSSKSWCLCLIRTIDLMSPQKENHGLDILHETDCTSHSLNWINNIILKKRSQVRLRNCISNGVRADNIEGSLFMFLCLYIWYECNPISFLLSIEYLQLPLVSDTLVHDNGINHSFQWKEHLIIRGR